MMPIPSRLLAPLALLLCLFVPAVCGAAANATAKPAAKANGAAPAKKAEEKKPDAKKPDAKKTDPKKTDANATPKPEPKPEPKPDKKTPPPFEMKTYMDGHKLLLQTLKNAKAFMEKEKSASQARAGMANYFLAEIDQATLLVNNGFDLVFLYFDHFLTADQLSTVMAAYIGNRMREVSHSLEDLAAEMAENLAKSPFAREQIMVDLHGQITGYHVTLGQVSQRVIPAR